MWLGLGEERVLLDDSTVTGLVALRTSLIAGSRLPSGSVPAAVPPPIPTPSRPILRCIVELNKDMPDGGGQDWSRQEK